MKLRVLCSSMELAHGKVSNCIKYSPEIRLFCKFSQFEDVINRNKYILDILTNWNNTTHLESTGLLEGK